MTEEQLKKVTLDDVINSMISVVNGEDNSVLRELGIKISNDSKGKRNDNTNWYAYYQKK